MTIIIVYDNCRFICFNMEVLLESLKLGVAPSIVVLIYLLINKYFDTKKESKQVKLTSDIIDNFNKLNNFLEYITKDIILKDNDKRNVGIKNAFDRFENNILKFSISTIIHNNVEHNKENIIDNINHTVCSEFDSLYNTLSLYSSSKYDVVKNLDTKWKEELINDGLNVKIKKRDVDCPEMSYFLNISYNGLVMPCCNMRFDDPKH